MKEKKAAMSAMALVAVPRTCAGDGRMTRPCSYISGLALKEGTYDLISAFVQNMCFRSKTCAV